MSNSYGKEMILDLYGCNAKRFTREAITLWLEELCELIDMKREDLHFWEFDDEEEKAAAPAHLDGTSAVQFIMTSNIVVHTLDKVGECYINIFTCKKFDPRAARDFTVKYFEAEYSEARVITRGSMSQCNI